MQQQMRAGEARTARLAVLSIGAFVLGWTTFLLVSAKPFQLAAFVFWFAGLLCSAYKIVVRPHNLTVAFPGLLLNGGVIAFYSFLFLTFGSWP